MIEKINEMIAQEDFPSLYEAMNHDALDLDTKQELHQLLVDMANEKIHDKMTQKCLLDFETQSEQFVLRILYENAIGAFEAGEKYEASEAFALLASASNSKLFEKAIKKHLLALLEGASFDVFIGTWIAQEAPKHFFISAFSKEVEKKFLTKESELAAATKRYTKLFK